MQKDMEGNTESNSKARAIIAWAIKRVKEMSPQETDGKWLEEVTFKAAPHIKEWDIRRAWKWIDWPEREKHFPNSTKQDVGIDVVAKRKDGEYIAIQCKSRKLDEQGEGGAIGKDELNSFISASVNPFWAELWIVTNGANSIGQKAEQALSMSGSKRPIKLINIAADLAAQQKKFDDEDRAASDRCAHCENPEDANAVQTKNCMQNEAIAQSVRILKEHAQFHSGGLPKGQARGRIILPCGTGKTRISLRIVEELTSPGELSIVLCPSIALVAQIRREYLQNAKKPIRALAVCSDETAGYDQRNRAMNEDKRNTAAATDPTLDIGYVGADIVKGKVSTDPADIKQWIESGQNTKQISVIFGTYQSGRALADAGKIDWTNPQTWLGLKVFDPAVGSGTLLAAMIAEFKRRARIQGASEARIASLQKTAVENTMIGMDINPVSLQLAAAQLCIGNPHLDYQKMRLRLMPYGPQPDGKVKAGALELLSQKAIVQRNELELPDESLKARQVWEADSIGGQSEDPEMNEAVQDASNCSIIIANPPFTNRAKMGEKFHDEIKKRLQRQVDGLEQMLVDNNPDFEKFMDKRALRPMFVGIAEKCVNQQTGVFVMISPTIAMTGPSGINERITLAKRFHIHTIFTVHSPFDINLSQDTSINESILILQKRKDPKPPTRILNLDRFPNNEEQLHSFFESLEKCKEGELPKDWGNLSFWPRERIERGDWTAAIWRNPELADAAAQFAECKELKTLEELGLKPEQTSRLLSGDFERTESFNPGSFPVLDSKGADGQTTIQSQPDGWWIRKKMDEKETERIVSKSGHLLISEGQDNEAARLVAVADDEKYFGYAYLTVKELTADQAKALAVFLNSTAGRLQIMRNAGRKLAYPLYRPASIKNIRVPDMVGDAEVCRLLKACWEETRNIRVPQYRDGDDWDGKHSPRHPKEKPENWLTGQSAEEFVSGQDASREKKGKGEGKKENSSLESSLNPRPIWDACVAKTLTARKGGGKEGNAENGSKSGNGLSADARRLFGLRRLNRLRSILHREPHIRGKAYNEHSDE